MRVPTSGSIQGEEAWERPDADELSLGHDAAGWLPFQSSLVSSSIDGPGMKNFPGASFPVYLGRMTTQA